MLRKVFDNETDTADSKIPDFLQMNFVVVSTAAFVRRSDGWYAYGPYVREMELWAKHAGNMHFVCPVVEDNGKMLLSKIDFPVTRVYPAMEFDLLSFGGMMRALWFAPWNFLIIFFAMTRAGHIHLRCPGNLSLIGCLVQILFPWKKKTAKYAGNWDPESAQPISYRWQKWLLNNTFLTRRMTVLVYGNWPGMSKNIKAFFTASYKNQDIAEVGVRKSDDVIRILFAGTLSENKRPLYSLKIAEALFKHGLAVKIRFYGEGVQRDELEKYIAENFPSGMAELMGNRSKGELQQAYCESNLLILPSKSEGWPKVVAEAMFWGCIPAASAVSCVPEMLGGGSRGIVLSMDLEKDVAAIAAVLQDKQRISRMAQDAMAWSRAYTMEKFEAEIKKLI